MKNENIKLVYTDDVLAVVDRIIHDVHKDPRMNEYADRSEDIRNVIEGVLDLTPAAGFQSEVPENYGCTVHKVGILKTGYNDREMDSNEFLQQVRRDPVMTQKYFRRYRRCPDCGCLIHWDDEVEA